MACRSVLGTVTRGPSARPARDASGRGACSTAGERAWSRKRCGLTRAVGRYREHRVRGVRAAVQHACCRRATRAGRRRCVSRRAGSPARPQVEDVEAPARGAAAVVHALLEADPGPVGRERRALDVVPADDDAARGEVALDQVRVPGVARVAKNRLLSAAKVTPQKLTSGRVTGAARRADREVLQVREGGSARRMSIKVVFVENRRASL